MSDKTRREFLKSCFQIGGYAAIASLGLGAVEDARGWGILPTLTGFGGNRWANWAETSEESLASSNIYVAMLENTSAGGNETAQGGGLTGDNLVLTQGGTVAGATGTPPKRAFDGVNDRFSIPVGVWDALIKNQTAWSIMMKVTGRTSAATTRYFLDFANDITITRIVLDRLVTTEKFQVVAFTDVPAGTLLNGSTTDALTNVDTWLGIWYDGTYCRAGFTTVAKPTKWSDFASTKRISNTITSTLTNSASGGMQLGSRFGADDTFCYSYIYYIVISSMCLIDNYN